MSLTKRKKVQCPQCREVVTLTESAPTNRTPDLDAGRDLSTKADWMARCENLRTRVETLEQQVEALMVSSRARTSLLPKRLDSSSAVPCDAPLPPDPLENGTVQREAPVAATSVAQAGRNRETPTGEVALVVTVGDRAAWQLAESLTEILVRAGWTVGGITENKALAHSFRGLTLAVGSAIPLQRVTRTLSALREAGYGMIFQIDPELGANEAALIVGAGAGSER
jgi:hypothetical protein